MNSAHRIELEEIREDQQRVHRLVSALDRRIERLDVRLHSPPAPIAAPVFVDPLLQAAPREVTPGFQEVMPAPEPPPLVEKPTFANRPPPTIPKTPSPERSAPSKPAEAPRVEPLELRVGTYWMARLGIVILLTGLVFLGNFAYQRFVPLLGAWGKLSLIGLAATALVGVGSWLEQARASTRNYGRVLMAGGAAAIYYTVYAAHFVAPLRVIESPLTGGAFLLVVAGALIWFAERRSSEMSALLVVLLSYYTSAINPIGSFTLFANLLLASVAVFYLARKSWVRVSFISLVATYASYAFWRFYHLVETGGAESAFGPVLAFLASYWLVFAAAAFLAHNSALAARDRVLFLTLNNGAFFALASQCFLSQRPDDFWIFAGALGVGMLALAGLSALLRREQRAMETAYLAQGLGLVAIACAAKLTGPQLAVVFRGGKRRPAARRPHAAAVPFPNRRGALHARCLWHCDD